MALSTPNFLTCSLWAVNTVIAEDRLLLWRSRTRPTRATSGMGASTHRVDPRRDRSNGRKNEPARGREHASPAWPSFASFADRCTSVSDNPSQIKSTFRMSRSAAAGSHAASTPEHAPGGCAGRCVPGHSARQYEGQGPMDCAAFTGTPGGMPIALVRCYTGTDGQSHFEDLDLLPT